MDDLLYWRICWIHDDPNDPITLYHEVRSDGWESRRVEVFADGHTVRQDETALDAVEALPSVEEIAAQSEFEIDVIDGGTFEEVWTQAAP